MKKKVAAIILGASLGVCIGGVLYGSAKESQPQNEAKTELAIAEDENTANPLTSEDDQIARVSLVDTEGSSQDFSYGNVADVAEAVMPSIVSITNKSVQEVQDWFYRRSYQYESESAGSGIIVGKNDTELLICTNNHVVEDASTLTVSFVDESSYEAQVKGTDASNDLAVVAVPLDEISDETMNSIKIAEIGDSDSMRVGEQVVAIGNALGYGQSVTTGIISAKDRSIGVSSGSYSSDTTSYENLIQTDAAINFGNSGGALLNMNGEVIGINSAKASASGVEGMGYAIPVSKAMPILEKLMTRRTRTLVDEDKVGYMGISGEGVSNEAVQFYNIPAGLYVTSVGDGTPADAAGLREGDIITAFDSEPIRSMKELQQTLQYYEEGETVEMTIQNNDGGAYEEKTITITLGSRADYQ